MKNNSLKTIKLNIFKLFFENFKSKFYIKIELVPPIDNFFYIYI